MQFDAERPIYLQLMEAIKLPALRGELAPGTALKSVREMARDMSVNPNTMARALNELEREGFIFTRRGTGSFITEDPVQIRRERDKFVNAIAEKFLAEVSELGLSKRELVALLSELKSRKMQAADSSLLRREPSP